MCLAIPAGLHFNSLLHQWVESSGLEYSLQSARLLLLHVGVAALALICAPVLRSAPPLKPCITAEHPCGVGSRPDDGACVSERSLLSPLSRQASSLASSLEGAPDTAALAHRLLRGHGRVRQGAWRDLQSLLTFWDFWVLLLAFSLTVGSFNVLHLLMEEFLERNPESGRILGMHAVKVLGSFGAIAFPAGDVPRSAGEAARLPTHDYRRASGTCHASAPYDSTCALVSTCTRCAQPAGRRVRWRHLLPAPPSATCAHPPSTHSCICERACVAALQAGTHRAGHAVQASSGCCWGARRRTSSS